MSARRFDPFERRTSGFVNRAHALGRFDDFERATRFAWEAEDRRREHRARRLALLARVPVLLWLLVVGVVVVGVVLLVEWASRHLLVSMLLGVVCVALLVWMVRRRRAEAAVVIPEPVAPHDARHTVRLDPLSTALSAEARAVVDSVDAARRNYYMDALQRGVLPGPTRVRDVGRDVVSIPLPGGRITADDVDLERFAGTLGLPASMVRRGPDLPGMLVVDLLDVDPSTRTVPAWPALGSATRWDEPMPLGVDAVGEPVSVRIAGRRVLVGGQSGSGKTRLIRMFGLWAGGDDRVKLHVLDCKGSPALSCLRDRAAWFHAGPPTADVLAHLTSLRDDMRARYARMRDGVDVVAAEGWVVLVADEVQSLWKVRGAVDVVEEIARMGREAGIGLILGSQAPNKDSVPTLVADQADVRISMRLPAVWASGMILGDYGIDASRLPAGHAFVSDDGVVSRVSTHHVDDEDAVSHLRGLPALPAGLPVLLGRAPAVDDVDVVRRVSTVIGDRVGATWDELTVMLDVDREDLQRDLRERGILSASFRPAGSDSTARGVRRVDVEGVTRA